ncbi:hypothetical protein DEO72_LG6g1018 [Vigna unguiculata]|uniref:Uncharacterized protein n=1 Tax=Vigna unguiculata TaxID=3917 RepID=A0A4D6M867_VIGUN|nr:hypothetical protein DEO72_LG6g1018 [Vigna unguiculata]
MARNFPILSNQKTANSHFDPPSLLVAANNTESGAEFLTQAVLPSHSYWEPGIFAWASSSRLSENTRNSPLELREVSSRRAGFA